MKRTHGGIIRIIWRLPLVLLAVFLQGTGRAQDINSWHASLSREGNDSRILGRNLTVDIGDSIGKDFSPKITLSAWNERAVITVLLDRGGRSEPYVTAPIIVSGKPGFMIRRDSLETHQFYIRPDSGLEWEIILEKPPDSNILIFPIESKGLEFQYQGMLSGEEISMGVERSDSVIGSYAVYYSGEPGNHVTVKGSDTAYENFSTGKAFHIYRPRARDSRGWTVWCGLSIDSVFDIAIPADFFANAEYPITIDPTFGNSTVGASTAYLVSNGCQALSENISYRHTASSGEIITSYSIYCLTYTSPAYVALAAYSYVDGYPADRLAMPTTLTVTNGSMQWNTSGTVSQGMTGGTTYVIAYGEVAPSSSVRCRFDSEANICSIHGNSTLPVTWVPYGYVSNRWSIYATYTAGATGADNYRRRAIVSTEFPGE
ncbi:hypothetical protein TRIP_C20550 [Candidatus Zixiibacteriota bacterium]|nr:hypothetical protein TRIP_C20550 [candidate division Zixibacteria bacterium]